MILRSACELEQHFGDLGPEDIYVGLLPLKFLKGPLGADLLERGVRCVPSVLCQLLSRSKCGQAVLFKPWMAPHTLVVTRRAELLGAATYYQQHRIQAVVSKQEGMHCGHGIRRWESSETLYNTVAYSDAAFPMVLQPFLSDITDIRVIVIGDYLEAYTRENRHNFRANLSAGGAAREFDMDAAAGGLCRAVLARGRFPYAHIDLHLTPGGSCYLSEITLDAGIAAARIRRDELKRRKQEVLETLAAQMMQDRHSGLDV